jgi:hypothetical protein
VIRASANFSTMMSLPHFRGLEGSHHLFAGRQVGGNAAAMVTELRLDHDSASISGRLPRHLRHRSRAPSGTGTPTLERRAREVFVLSNGLGDRPSPIGFGRENAPLTAMPQHHEAAGVQPAIGIPRAAAALTIEAVLGPKQAS